MEKSKLSLILFVGIVLVFCAISAYAIPPNVTKTIPENGNQNIDPSLRKIRIEFDQDMISDGYSICGGGPKYPKTVGKPKWINKRTLLMRVKLEPSHEYEFSINCPSYKNFKNLHGESAVIYPIKFKTTTAGEKSSKPTKSSTQLLQEGLYAEETEGDLEKAIGLYEQVLDQHKEVERLAARATYQLGMCHLKKGDKDKAAEYFQQVISNYPSQKTLAGKATRQLRKLPIEKTKIKYTFGPTIEKVINDKTVGDNFIFDLDAGKFISMPQDITSSSSPEKVIPWILENGVDFLNYAGRLQLWDMVAVEVEEKSWDSPDTIDVDNVLVRGPSKEFLPTWKEEYTITNPYTYVFETREGGRGLLQVLEKRSTYLKIRYKMLQKGKAGVSEKDKLKADAFTTVDNFLKASMAGDISKAMKLVKPGSAVDHQLKDFAEIPNHETAQIASVHADNKKAFAITNAFFEDNGHPVLLTFTLIKQRGLWVVEDIDMETPQKAKADLQTFLKEHPIAGPILVSRVFEKEKSRIDLSSPEATIKSFVKAVYSGNLDAAMACVSKDGHDYENFKEMLATESNHPFQAMIKAMDASIPVEITSKDITEGKCKIKWYVTLGRVYYFGDTKIEKGTHQEFSSYLELVDGKWLIRDL